MAYPDASTTMVAQALKLQAAYDAARPRLDVDDPRALRRGVAALADRRAGAVTARMLAAGDDRRGPRDDLRSSCWRRCATGRPTPRGPPSPRSTSRSRACPGRIWRACRSCARRRGAFAGARATTCCWPPTTTGPSSRGWPPPHASSPRRSAHCAFWPGADDPAEVVRWARARELHAGFSVVGSPHASVEEVGDALGAARARRGARRADDGPRRRGASGRLEGLVIDVADLQGGIVRGYGKCFGFARHLFARVREPRAARAFLAALADPVTTEQEWAGHPETTLNVALSYRALAALELPAWILDGFPRGAARRHGGARRAPRRRPRHLGRRAARPRGPPRRPRAERRGARGRGGALGARAARRGQRARARPRAAGRRCSASSASTSASPTASRSRPSRASPARTSAARGSPTSACRGGR